MLKFGQGCDLLDRIRKQKNVFKGFYLDNFFKTHNPVQLERTFRKYINTKYDGHIEIIKFEDYSEIQESG